MALLMAWVNETCLLDPKKGQAGGGCACVLWWYSLRLSRGWCPAAGWFTHPRVLDFCAGFTLPFSGRESLIWVWFSEGLNWFWKQRQHKAQA